MHNIDRRRFLRAGALGLGAGLLEPGDQVVVDLRAELVVGEYVWRWNTTVTGADGEPRWRYRQSTLLGVPLSAASLRRRASTHVSTLGRMAR